MVSHLIPENGSQTKSNKRLHHVIVKFRRIIRAVSIRLCSAICDEFMCHVVTVMLAQARRRYLCERLLQELTYYGAAGHTLLALPVVSMPAPEYHPSRSQ